MGLSHADRPYLSRRSFLQGGALLGGALATGPYFWAQPAYAADTPVSHLHLQYGADAAREATVRLANDRSGPGAVQLDGSRVAARTRQYPGNPGSYFHSASLSGLRPASTTAYRIGPAGKALAGVSTAID